MRDLTLAWGFPLDPASILFHLHRAEEEGCYKGSIQSEVARFAHPIRALLSASYQTIRTHLLLTNARYVELCVLRCECELEIGGYLPQAEAATFLEILSRTATFLKHDRSLVSFRSNPQDSLLKRIEEGPVKYIFSDGDSHEIPSQVEKYLNERKLDYRWCWHGFHYTTPGVECYDADLDEGAEFMAVAGKIVLDVTEVSNPSRWKDAKRWHSWNPRPLVFYSTNHELIEAHIANRQY